MMDTKQSILATALCLLFIAAPDVVNAQSVDSCMTSKGEEAVQTCQSLLKSGNRSAEVYYQLASQLYQLGRTSEAMAILDNGLSRHKSNTLLTTLRNTLEFDSAEQAALRASAKKNEAVMNRGQLKITCLTKISRAALEACEGYLAQTNIDGDKIRARAQIIATEITPSPTTQIAVAPTTPVAPVVVPEVSKPPAVIEPAPLNEAQIALRELIRNIQSDLSSLGFSVGIPDGIAGPRTRTAVREFYERTQQIQSDRLDDQTLVDVQAAVVDLNTSERFLKQSRLAASNQQLEQAISLLASAERSSPLFKAPVGYRQNLELQLSRQTTAEQTPVASTGSQPPPSTVAQAPQAADTQTDVQAGTTASIGQSQQQQLPDLISQIESLTATLSLRRVNGRRQNQAMRDAVDALFQ